MTQKNQILIIRFNFMKEIFEKMMEKALVKLKGFHSYCEVFNLCRSFL